MPCLALRGLASAISTSPSLKAKVVLRKSTHVGVTVSAKPAVNSSNDRETPDYKASDYVAAITTCLKRFDRSARNSAASMISDSKLVTHVVHLEGAGVEIDRERIEVTGQRVISPAFWLIRYRPWVCSSSKSRGMPISVQAQPPRFSHQMPCNGLWNAYRHRRPNADLRTVVHYTLNASARFERLGAAAVR